MPRATTTDSLAVCAEGACNVPQAADFTGVSESAIWAAMAAGELEFFYFRSGRLVARRELVRWLSELHARTATTGRKSKAK
jgi:predicted DNA-binding transcriptional regulator AlpA